MTNLGYYEKLSKVPAEAKKPIEAGRLKGMTSISPMWRIKAITEIFGPCGIGWKIEFKEAELIDIELTGEKLVKVECSLYIREKDAWSEPIFGVGTSKLLAKERNGMYLDEESYKKARTDAFGYAAKYIGVGGDVYLKEDTENKEMQGTPVTPQLKYPLVGAALADDEIITKEQALHIADCIMQEGKNIDAIIGYLNTRPKRTDNTLDTSDSGVLGKLTFEEYETLLYMFSGFQRK